MKKISTFIAGLVILCLPARSQTITDPSNTPGYDQQKIASINRIPIDGQILFTDSLDYHPGSTVTINGAGFQAAETVEFRVIHANGTFDNETSAAHQSWTAIADNSGGFQTTWIVPVGPAEEGSHLKLTSEGMASGYRSVALFTSGVPTNPFFIQPDSSYQTFFGNDDQSIGPFALPFSFNMYGTSYNQVYINNNGNLTFTAPYSFYSATGFPFNVPMVAPFWSDVDTRNPLSGLVKYKINSTHMIVTWEGVGYFNQHADKLNTFQVVISNSNVALIGIGTNVAFHYGDMQWTTGDASGGIGGFGGIPATVGINKGNSIDFVQIGRFGVLNSDYDGGGGATDGINYLDNQHFSFNVSGISNQVPSVSGVPLNNTINVACGATETISLSFLPPEIGQSVTLSIDTGDLCNSIRTVTSGPVATADVTISGTACNRGTHVLTITATDNYNPPANTVIQITVNVASCILPYYPPPANGKVDSLSDVIGAELLSINQKFRQCQ